MAKRAQAAAAPADGETDIEQLRRELADVKSQLAANASRAETAETRASVAEQRVLSEAEQRLLAQEQACDGNIASKTSEADAIEAQIATLSEEPGHGKEIASLTRKLAGLEADVREETNKKTWLANQRTRAGEAAKQQAAADTRKLANGVALSSFTNPRDRAWFEAHPRCFTDPRYLKAVIRSAEDLTDEDGLRQGTTEHYQALDQRIAEAFPDEGARRTKPGNERIPTAESPYSGSRRASDDGEDLTYEPAKPQPRAAGPGAMAAIPPSRTAASSSASAGGNRRPLLTPDEREAADAIMGHIPNAADRYQRYAENREFMNQRRGANQHFN